MKCKNTECKGNNEIIGCGIGLNGNCALFIPESEKQALSPVDSQSAGSISCIDCLKELGQDDQRIIITKNVDSLEDDFSGPFCEECYDFITTHAGK